jgi:hypothetical protein
MEAFRGDGRRPGRMDIIVGIIALAIGVAFVSQGCILPSYLRTKPTPVFKDVDLTELLVTQSELPKGWITWQRTESSFLPATIDSWGIWFKIRQSDGDFIAHASHIIGRYSSRSDAQSWHEIEIERRRFSQGGIVGEWYVPEELEYQSSVADQFRLACAKTSFSITEGLPQEKCEMLGRYAEFITYFSTSIHPDYMTYSEFEEVVKEIDRRFAEAAGKPLPTTDSP